MAYILRRESAHIYDISNIIVAGAHKVKTVWNLWEKTVWNLWENASSMYFQAQQVSILIPKDLRLRYFSSGKEKATTPWLQNHQLHAKERTSVAGHPGIFQAKDTGQTVLDARFCSVKCCNHHSLFCMVSPKVETNTHPH